MTAREHLVNIRQLLKIEKEEDYKQYQNKILNTSVQERKREGVCWYPIQIQSHKIGTGERIEIQVEKPIEDDSGHVFQVGSVVSLFHNLSHQERADYVGGVVSYLRRNVMKVILNTSDFPEWIYNGKLGVDLMFDEGTYREMDRAIVKVINAEEGRLSEMKAIFYGEKKAHIRRGHDYASIELNSKQNEALTNILNAEDVAIIHGPPGTGKTTTLVQAIKEIVNLEKQVLVSAPSNAAVDLLVEKISDQGIDVLRLGHPARVSGAALEKSLDHRISIHPHYKRLKDSRKKAEELKKLGFKYKRNFGAAERNQRKSILDEARNIKLEADHIEHYIITDLLNAAQVVACTLINANHKLIRSREFKSVFIDEASQALEPACWIPIMKANRVILAGDHFQLPPTIKSLKAAKEGLEVTLFEKGINNQNVAVMLQEQYRMHPVIMDFPSEVFYGGNLSAAPEVLNNPLLDDKPFEFIDTAGCGFDEKIDKLSQSTYNDQEAALLVSHLEGFLTRNQDNIKNNAKTIGVIAPYKAQINLLNELIDREPFNDFKGLLSVNTVDAFQGQERDVIYISLVRSNEMGEIGFLKEVRRLNVAMTRSKVKLVIFGDSATLGRYEFFGDLLTYVEEIDGYKSAFELID